VRYPENFLSSECLFGFDDCPKGADFIIVTEGAREVMKLAQEGFPAVAILGAYVSPTHRTLLAELYPKRIVLMFDGDDAGSAITTRVADALTGGGVYSKATVQKCLLPRGRDPKNLDREILIRLIENRKISIDDFRKS
jgi:DNA primase